MQLEPVEPAHRALAFGIPLIHGPVHVHPLDVARNNRSRVDDRDACALAEGAGLEEQQEVRSYLGLAFHETVVSNRVGELLAHVQADIPEVE